MPKITPEAFNALTDRELPIAANYGFRVEEIGDGTARVRAPFNATFTRPGGTISSWRSPSGSPLPGGIRLSRGTC